MRDAARDPAALELLRVQRSRLADRMRLPWWYLTGSAILWAVVFTGPFSSRYLPQEVPTWPILVAFLAVACLLQWGQNQATGIKLPFRNLRYRPGRPVGIAILVVFLTASETEFLLVGRGLLVAAIVVAALGVVAEMALLRVALRVTRRELRGGGAAA
jgi:branched-subunit amino acid transport protein AzlD